MKRYSARQNPFNVRDFFTFSPSTLDPDMLMCFGVYPSLIRVPLDFLTNEWSSSYVLSGWRYLPVSRVTSLKRFLHFPAGSRAVDFVGSKSKISVWYCRTALEMPQGIWIKVITYSCVVTVLYGSMSVTWNSCGRTTYWALIPSPRVVRMCWYWIPTQYTVFHHLSRWKEIPVVVGSVNGKLTFLVAIYYVKHRQPD